MTTDDDEEALDSSCPFCGSDEDCDHLLLFVDKTFRTAEGGVLRDAFNTRWSQCFDQEDFNEREAFDELLDEVACLSDAMTDHVHDAMPGMSSAYATYFVESKARAKEALASFALEEE